jgi:hypothetical protein
VSWPAITAAISLAGWLGVLLGTARAWDLRPVGEDEPAPPEPQAWPSVAVLVPARNEADLLPLTLPALRAQDYPGEHSVVVVDDRSTDLTRELATVSGAELPPCWVGKVWALEQARGGAGEPDYYLLTDADIRHAPGSLRRLVAESEAAGLALNSRMARLRCSAPAEKLLIPPFVYFFNLLYPMRRVNRRPAAAGGCMLVRRDALEAAGGFEAIRDRVIDDVSPGARDRAARADPARGQPLGRREPARARPGRNLAHGTADGIHRAAAFVGTAGAHHRLARAPVRRPAGRDRRRLRRRRPARRSLGRDRVGAADRALPADDPLLPSVARMGCDTPGRRRALRGDDRRLCRPRPTQGLVTRLSPWMSST